MLSKVYSLHYHATNLVKSIFWVKDKNFQAQISNNHP